MDVPAVPALEWQDARQTWEKQLEDHGWASWPELHMCSSFPGIFLIIFTFSGLEKKSQMEEKSVRGMMWEHQTVSPANWLFLPTLLLSPSLSDKYRS